MENSIWEELESFIRKEAGVGNKKILAKSDTLERDLDITGDDAEDFMGNFFLTFKVDHGDFSLDQYFSGEGFNPFEMIAMIFSKKTRQKYDKEPVTLGMLEAAVLAGVWNSEQLASVRSRTQ
jgi:hypothetical protein